MTIEQLKVLITAETSGLKKEIKTVSNALRGLDATASKTSKSIGTSFKTLFKGLSMTAGILALTKLSKTALATASDLEEV